MGARRETCRWEPNLIPRKGGAWHPKALPSHIGGHFSARWGYLPNNGNRHDAVHLAFLSTYEQRTSSLTPRLRCPNYRRHTSFGGATWAGRGRTTVDANDKPVAEVIRSARTAGRHSDRHQLPVDAKVTIADVRKVPLLHALEVLYHQYRRELRRRLLCCTDEGSIDVALATMANGQGARRMERWSMPPIRGFDGEAGSSDPRLENGGKRNRCRKGHSTPIVRTRRQICCPRNSGRPSSGTPA